MTISDRFKDLSNSIQTQIVTGILGTLATSALAFKFRHWLLTVVIVPRWMIVLLAVSSVIAGTFAVVVVVRSRRPKRPQPTRFSHFGADWMLKENFFRTYETAQESTSGVQFLSSHIVGPFCPACHTDVTDSLATNRCNCGQTLDFPDRARQSTRNRQELSTLLQFVKTEVYQAAQARARAGSLKPKMGRSH